MDDYGWAARYAHVINTQNAAYYTAAQQKVGGWLSQDCTAGFQRGADLGAVLGGCGVWRPVVWDAAVC